MKHLQWFPGHMTAAMRMMEDSLKAVDGVMVVLDARAPRASINNKLNKLFANKKVLYRFSNFDLVNSLPQRGRGTAERWMRRSFADLLYGSTTYFTRAIPFKITILVNFFKDGLSFQGRPPHPPARGVRLSQFSRWRRLTHR